MGKVESDAENSCGWEKGGVHKLDTALCYQLEINMFQRTQQKSTVCMHMQMYCILKKIYDISIYTYALPENKMATEY